MGFPYWLAGPVFPSCLFGKMILTAPTMLHRDPHLQPRDWFISESHHPARKSEGSSVNALAQSTMGYFLCFSLRLSRLSHLVAQHGGPGSPRAFVTVRIHPSSPTEPAQGIDQGPRRTVLWSLCSLAQTLLGSYKANKNFPRNPSFSCTLPPRPVKECLYSICH